MKNMLPIIEGLLFLTGDEGIGIDEIKLVLEIEDDQIKLLLEEFKQSLNNENRGLILVELGQRYKLTTKPQHFDYYQKLVDNPINFTFSNAALETLAIIAYNQPVTRLEIEKIRGVNSDNMVRKLLAKSLVKEAGQKESLGRPMTYEVTNEFLDIFNLQSIEELPELENIEFNDEDQDIFTTRFMEESV